MGIWAFNGDLRTGSREGHSICTRPPVTERAVCPDFVACQPRESCLGNNTCHHAYLYVQLQCLERRIGQWEDERSPPETRARNKCTRQQDCTCWECRNECSGRGVSKSCVECKKRNRCLVPEDDCYWKRPQDCSRCVLREVMNPKTNKIDLQGTCECAPSVRCTKCTLWTHFRSNGECKECPKNLWMLLLGIFFAVAGLGYAAHMMQKRNVNLAYLAVGVDYFQVVGMFAGSKIRWPPVLFRIMISFSLFNFNLDLAAPECSFPDVTFTFKWTVMQCLPLLAGVLMLAGHIVRYLVIKCPISFTVRPIRVLPFHNKCIAKIVTLLWLVLPQVYSVLNLDDDPKGPGFRMQLITLGIMGCGPAGFVFYKFAYFVPRLKGVHERRASLRQGLTLIVSNWILVIYCMYLPMTRGVLEIYNCAPTRPPDGYEYMQAVFEKCWVEDGVHAQLLPLSWLFGFIYTFGIPFTFYTILVTNKKRVQADIELNAQVGNGQLEYLTENQIRDIKMVFEHTDIDGGGTISISELRKMMSSLNMHCSGWQFEELVAEVDADKSGEIDFSEFCAFVANRLNPNHTFRKCFNLIYKYYRAERYYWVLAILSRKTIFCFASLMFRRNPGFQLAVCLFTLFCCYVQQVKHTPYRGFKDEIVKAAGAAVIKAATDEGDNDTSEERQSKQILKATRSKSMAALISDEQFAIIQRRQREKIELRYFWDVNTVEMTLLGCGVIVSLSGIMFETIPVEEEDYYQPHIYFVTVICLSTLIFSVFYWVGVFSSEIAGYKCQTFKKYLGEENFITRKKKRGHLMGDVMDKLKIEPKKKSKLVRRMSHAIHGAAHALHLDTALHGAAHALHLDRSYRRERKNRKKARKARAKGKNVRAMPTNLQRKTGKRYSAGAKDGKGVKGRKRRKPRVSIIESVMGTKKARSTKSGASEMRKSVFGIKMVPGAKKKKGKPKVKGGSMASPASGGAAGEVDVLIEEETDTEHGNEAQRSREEGKTEVKGGSMASPASGSAAGEVDVLIEEETDTEHGN